MNAVSQVQEASAVYAVEQNALLRSFDLLATAPEGVARLRELILSLAVQGKLVPQDSQDEPAGILLERIRTEKQALIKAGKIKKDKPLAEIAEEEKLYELPQGWEWARLGSLGQVVGGGTPKSDDPTLWSEKGIHWLTPADLYGRKEKTISFGRRDISEKGLTSSSAQLLPAGTVLFSSRAPIGYVAIAANSLATNQGFKSCVPYLESFSDYLYWFLKKEAKAIDASASGTTFKEISGGDFSKVVVSVPPMVEQARIVARVEELMQLCDALERQDKLGAAQHARLVSTLFDALAKSESAHALAENWQRVVACFDLLLDRPEAVDALEQTILQLAVRGLLVPQNLKDEPACELLKQIRQEKDRLITAGKIKRDKPLPKISEEEKPFGLPQGWEWIQVGNAFNTTSGNTFDVSLEKQRGQYMYIKVGDMNLPGNALVITTATRFIDADKKLEGSLIPAGSIIFPKRGGAIATNKKRLIEAPVFVDLNTMAITPILVSTAYAYLWLLTIDLAELNTGTSVPQINHQDIDPLPFPLPPLAEQSRIVARIAELRQLCAELRARLSAARATQTRLAETLVEQAA